jgi:FMN-dependent NADH-azoreductase
MKLLHISCSPRGHESESYALAQKIIAPLLEASSSPRLVERMLGRDPIPHIGGSYAVAHKLPSEGLVNNAAIACSELLIRELESADALVISTPMHNLTVPSVLKAWIDNVVRAGRTFNVTPGGKIGTLRDRPTFIAVASGGKFSGERARQPDFLTPYLETVLATIGLHDLAFFSVEGTGLGPETVADARLQADQAILRHFRACPPDFDQGIATGTLG